MGAVGAAPIQSLPAPGAAVASPQGLSGMAVLAASDDAMGAGCAEAASGVAHGLSDADASMPADGGAASAFRGVWDGGAS
jgi:hypothetical protein